MQRTGGVKLKPDAYAVFGETLWFPKGSHRKKLAAQPKHAAHFTFTAEPGRYWLWLRGKTSKGAKNDSVWVAVDKQIGSRNTSFRQGAGNFRDNYPVNAFAWSSAFPADPPRQVQLKGRTHTLVLSSREGPVAIDEVVLSKQWREHPQDNAPVVPQ